MRKHSAKHFKKFSTTPIDLKPFSKYTKQKANEYLVRLNKSLRNLGLRAYLHGSTFLEICGKGEIDIIIGVPENKWFPTLIQLINHYHSIGNLEEKYARFNDIYKDTEVEIILMPSKDAQEEQRLLKYLKSNKSELDRYVKVKKKFSYNKRRYVLEKYKFLEKIERKMSQ
jgi:GrpB-like predicted nucleotidyltransferase (UPF0157 family)